MFALTRQAKCDRLGYQDSQTKEVLTMIKTAIVTYRISCSGPKDLFVPYDVWPKGVSKETLQDLDENGAIPCDRERNLSTSCTSCRFGSVDWVDSEEEKVSTKEATNE